MADLNAFDTEKTSTLVLLDPFTGEPLDSEIDVVWTGSQTARRAIAERQKGMKEDLSEADKEELGLEYLVSLITNWRKITENGKPVKFTKAKAREYLKKYPTIADQVFAHSNKGENYSPKH